MRIISSGEIDACLEDRQVLESLRRAFRSNTIAPEIGATRIGRLNQQSGSFSWQPAWTDFEAQGDVSRGYVGCSIELALPEQNGQSSGLYLLFSGSAGQPIALLDGVRLADWRTAGLHALAASYLSREDTSRLLIIGDSPLIPRLACAYAAVRNFTSILLSGSSKEMQKRLSGLPALNKVHIGTTAEIHDAQEGADMICIAGPDKDTGNHHNLTYLDPPAGCHIDVVDANASLPTDLQEEGRLFTTDLKSPPFTHLEWAADLKDLTQGNKAGRRYYGQRTLFLHGNRTAIADYALATHIFLRS